MSGIAAIINLNKQTVGRQGIEAMTRAVTHRGPDGEQYFFYQNLAFGHRLNTLNAADFSSKPFDNEDITVLLDGEIFNRSEVLEKLKIPHVISDSEIIAKAYTHWEFNFLEHLDGKWAIIIHDKKRERVIAIRDRFAFKPLYFSTINNQFCLASEIKQFTVLDKWSARLNHDRARDFLAFGRQDHTDETLFEGVQQVVMGQFLVFDLKNHDLSKQNYYDLKKAPPQYPFFENAKKDLQNIVFEGINRHLTKDETFGTMLSGGLDSTIVTLALKQLLEKKGNYTPFETFSLTLDETHPLDESKFIDIVSDFGSLSPHKIQPDVAVFQQHLNDFIYFQDEPVSTDSAFAQFSIFQYAATMGIRRIFGGTGADAALAGYTKYMLVYLRQLQCESKWRMLREMLGFVRYSGLSVVFAYLKKQQLTNNHFSNWLNSDFIKNIQPNPFHTPKSLYEYTIEVYLTDATVALHFDDRSAAAFAIESYFPLYDRKFVELSLGLPDDFKIKNGKQKYILREAFNDLIPSKIYNRHDKKGFYNPGEDWMQQDPDWWIAEMQTIIQENKNIFNPKILTIFENFARHNRLSISEGVFWRIFFFGKWMKRFNVQY